MHRKGSHLSSDFCLQDVDLAARGIPERFSAKVDYVCTGKIAFDEAQFRYLATKKPQLIETIQNDVLPSLHEVRQVIMSLVDPPLATEQDVCVSLSNSDMDRVRGYPNRAYFLQREPMLSKSEPLCHAGAANKMRRAHRLTLHTRLCGHRGPLKA